MSALLLVDGDRNFAQALAIALKLDGVAVVAVASVEEALAALGLGGFGACVVDCLLPGADDLFTRLSSADGVRVVATGVHAEILGSTARRHSGLRTLEKPFQVGDLKARLGEPAEAR